MIILIFQSLSRAIAGNASAPLERGAISLVERRQEMLRQRVSQLEEEITSLLTMAARNEKIYQFNTELSFQLLNCADLVSLKEILADSLKLQFNFSHVRLISVLDADMKAIWDQRLHKGHYFGRLTEQEAKRLFGSEVGSVALTKLSEDNPVILPLLVKMSPIFILIWITCCWNSCGVYWRICLQSCNGR